MQNEILVQKGHDVDDVAFCASDVRFHVILANASHNPLLAFLTAALLDSLQPVTNLIVFRFRDRKQSATHHTKIMRALEARNAEAAVAALEVQMAYIKTKYKQARAWQLNNVEKKHKLRVIG
jgi:GntR family transcriptional regulator, transcriptional repressor for pyruvate dehydrogenase complex